MESHGHYCVPFFSSRQELLGVFTVYLKAGSQREEHVEKALTAATQVLANILERKKSEKESEESQKRYREVVEGTGDLITWMSPEGRLTFVNHMAPTIFGLPPEESNGKSIFDFVHPEDRLRAEEWFQQCIAHKTAQGTIENRLVNQKTGESHYLLWTANFHYDEEGQLSGVSGVGRDITERHARETLLQQSKNTLQKMVEQRTAELQETHLQLLHAEKLSAIGRLSASIAHEFNNPLFGVLNVLDSVKRYVPLTENFTTLLDMANRECLRMKELIRDLQDFNRPTSGIRAPMDIHQTTDAILLLSKKEFKNRNITVQKDFSQDLPLINAIADQIKQVLLNLLTNAVDACAAKGGKISIRTSMHGKYVAIAIQDTGNGINPEHMSHIFEPFFTTKPGVKGTGLGLSVSYGIIKRHGGRIEVNSEVGNGSTFTILLPIK
jgi:PAS domain S-box-containing protein